MIGIASCLVFNILGQLAHLRNSREYLKDFGSQFREPSRNRRRIFGEFSPTHGATTSSDSDVARTRGGSRLFGHSNGRKVDGGGNEGTRRSRMDSPANLDYDWSGVSDEDASTPSDLTQAHTLRLNGNRLFREGKIHEAIRCFGLALTVTESPIVLASRAACFLRQGHYMQALEDASRALTIQPNNAKALYRRGLAQMRLERWEEAMRDFEKARIYSGGHGDRELTNRLGECQAVLDLMAQNSFDASVQAARSVSGRGPDIDRDSWELDENVKRRKNNNYLSENTWSRRNNQEDGSRQNVQAYGEDDDDRDVDIEGETPRISPQPEMGPTTDYKNFDWHNLQVDPSYSGPRIGPEGITLEFVIKMIEHFKARKLLHRKYLWYVLTHVLEMYNKMPSLVRITLPKSPQTKHGFLWGKKQAASQWQQKPSLSVCGDTHGQFYDLIHIFELNGLPGPENPYLFNGDFVDRGPFSFETVTTLLALKCLYPEHVHLLRGNHESRLMNKIYGFMAEVCDKYTMMEYDLFEEVFDALPLAAVLDSRVLVLHGGLFKRKNVTLAEIEAIDRFRDVPSSGLMCEMLWSDPKMGIGIGRSPRGVACSFGPDVTAKFLKRNKLDLIVRSHEVRAMGYSWEHNRRLITVFSAPNYCGQNDNKGALLRFSGDRPTEPEIIQFGAVDAPKVEPFFDPNAIAQLYAIQAKRNEVLSAMESNEPGKGRNDRNSAQQDVEMDQG